MIAVEEDQENGNGRRERKQPILCKYIGEQQTATVEETDAILLCLADTVEGRKIEVGGGTVDVDVVVTGPEDAGKREELVIRSNSRPY